jgi:hypothetical protein
MEKEVRKMRAKFLKHGYHKRKFNLKAMIPKRLFNNNRKLRDKLDQLRSVLASTAAMDFECDFNGEGLCKKRVKYGASGITAPMCCCDGCAYSRGYHTHCMHEDGLLCMPSEVKYYRDCWDDLLGFWRPGTGCVLDREKRSITCVFFNCLDQTPGGDGKEKSEAIRRLWGVARSIETEIINIINSKS